MAQAQANNTGQVFIEPGQIVSVKSLLSDEWEDQPNFWCQRATSNAGQDIGTASFLWRYGDIIQPGETSWQTLKPKNLIGKYVRVQLSRKNKRRTLWSGVFIDETFNRSLDADQSREQVLVAKEWAYIADMQDLDAAWAHVKKDSDDWAVSTVPEYEIAQIGRFPDFNFPDPSGFGLKGNRSVDLASATDAAQPDIYVFGGGSKWTLRQVVEYLAEMHAPTGWTIKVTGQPEILDFTRVITRTEGIKMFAAIAHSIDKRKGASFRFEATDDISGNFDLRIMSTTPNDISLGGKESSETSIENKFTVNPITGEMVLNVNPVEVSQDTSPGGTFPKNNDKITLNLDTDATAPKVSIQVSSASHFDKVIARGDRSIACCSFSVADGTLEPGWTSSDEKTYANGSFDGSDENANERFRGSEAMSSVYRLFKVPSNWNWRAGIGVGDGTNWYSIDLAQGQDWNALSEPNNKNLMSVPLEGETFTIKLTYENGAPRGTTTFEYVDVTGGGSLSDPSYVLIDYDSGGSLADVVAATVDAINNEDFVDIIGSGANPIVATSTAHPFLVAGIEVTPSIGPDGLLVDEHSPTVDEEKEFLRRLPIRNAQGVNNTNTAYLAPLAFAKTTDPEDDSKQYYVQLDNNPNVEIGLFGVDGELAIRIVATPNHRTAWNKFDPFDYVAADTYVLGDRVTSSGNIYQANDDIPVSTPPPHAKWNLINPTPEAYNESKYTAENTIDYGTLIVTLAIETDEVLKYEATSQEASAFENENVLTLRIAGAGLNYVVPGTVWTTHEEEVQFHNGKVLRNDYAKLRAIAKTALAWYGAQRAAINATWSTIDKDYRLCSMIEDLSESQEKAKIQTIATSKTWDFTSGTFSLSTGFAGLGGGKSASDLDFPGLSKVREVAHEIKRIARRVDQNLARTSNIPLRIGGGIGGHLTLDQVLAYASQFMGLNQGGVKSNFDGT